MPQEPNTGTAEFIRRIRGASGEFASLLYLAAALRQRGMDAQPDGPPSEEQLQTINLLRIRIAELSRFSEKKMHQAAVKLAQLGSVRQAKEARAEAAQPLEPIRQLLEERINRSRRTIQVGLQAVNDLDGLIAPAPVKSIAKSRVRAAPNVARVAPKKVAPKKAAAPMARSGAVKKAKKTATRKRTTRKTRGTAAEPGGGTTSGA
jgi:hypothetical protein